MIYNRNKTIEEIFFHTMCGFVRQIFIEYKNINMLITENGYIIDINNISVASFRYDNINKITKITSGNIQDIANIELNSSYTKINNILNLNTTNNILSNDGDIWYDGTDINYKINGSVIALTDAKNILNKLTNKGDILTFSTSATKLSVGQDGQVLVADSTQITGLKWVTSDIFSAMSQLSDVTFPSQLKSGNFIKFDSTLLKWVNVDGLTTKGDILTFDTNVNRLSVGSNGQLLMADRSQATGLKWGNTKMALLSDVVLTTLEHGNFLQYKSSTYSWINVKGLHYKGDLLTFDVGVNRLGVGTDGQILIADSSQPTGLLWKTPENAISLLTDVKLTSLMSGNMLNFNGIKWVNVKGLINKGDLLTFDTSVNRLGIGSDGQVLIADSTKATGLKWGTVTVTTPSTPIFPTYFVNKNNNLLSEGYNQCGNVGTQKKISSNYITFFDTTTVNINSKCFNGGIFDGRYIYMIPNNNSASGQITQYDTTISFTNTSSYNTYNTVSVDINSKGFSGGVYDGRYLYLIPYYNGSYFGQITRYDTTLSFTDVASYSVFDTTTVNTNSKGFHGGLFDGRYVYLIPRFISTGVGSGQITRYDTTMSFISAASYSVYDTTNVNANSKGFRNGIFDGRYIYLVPFYNGTSYFGQITRYDTTLSFTSISSYSVFDTSTVNANSKGFSGGLFDGKFIYLISNNYGSISGQITRYDISMSFTSVSSYSVFDTTTVNTNSKGFDGGIFDGKYIYFIPNNNGTIFGQITIYDTTKPFNLSSSYYVIDTATTNTNSKGFSGGIFDGKYIFMIPNSNGQITRIEGYTGTPISSITPLDSLLNVSISSVASGNLLQYNSTLLKWVNVNSLTTKGDLLAFDTNITRFPVGLNDQVLVADNTQTSGLRWVTMLSSSGSGASSTLFYNKTYNLLTEGFNQGGHGLGTVGTKKKISTNYVSFFDTATINTNSKGFSGSVFDGTYLYFIPSNNGAPSGQMTRYDTTQSFTSYTAYSFYNTTLVNANSKGFSGGVFDGKFIYLIPYYNGTNFGQITRYDVSQSFTTNTSYSVFDTATVNANSKTFQGAVFDRRYIYLIPENNGVYFGQITRYDTTLSFTSASSYSVFDTTTVNINSKGFNGGVFDGRYIYLVPNNNGSPFGQITRYDTTLSFTSASSYSVFDTTTVHSSSKGFHGAVFDGKYIYFIPSNNGVAFGQITRYDITLPFTSASSYSVFDTTTVHVNSKGFEGGTFDGKYLYLTPNNNGTLYGQITVYDTTLPFNLTSSYYVFDTTAINSSSKGFMGSGYDGRYIYFLPYDNGFPFGQITRIEAYTGSSVSNITSLDCLHNVTIYSTNHNDVIQYDSSTSKWINNSIPKYFFYNKTNNLLSEQYKIGNVGTQKKISTNFLTFFDTSTVNALSNGFYGGSFDGKYLYYITYGGLITRYDSSLPFNLVTSYTIYNSGISGTYGSIYDGRYLYIIPYLSGTLVQYDTTLSLTSAASYSTFNTLTVNANSSGFIGSVFDGRYIYLSPGSSGIVTRYDVFLSFTSATSYSTFDITTANANSKGFHGATFDGRYIYFVPYNNGAIYGLITRYDTTLSFTSAASYSFFDATTVNENSKGFQAGVFDGRYIYFIPYSNGISLYGQITRYDTTMSFSSVSSYAVFDTATVDVKSKGFFSGIYDGKYLYLVPYNNGQPSVFGQITIYDTSKPFNSISSYYVFDTMAINSNSKQMTNAIFDGKYIYFMSILNGQIARIEGYTGTSISNITSIECLQNVNITSINNNDIIKYDVSSSKWINIQIPKYFPNKINNSLIEGYNQCFGSGSVGTQKILNTNYINFFDSTTVHANSRGFYASVFDGIYIYFVPYSNGTSGLITRYDSTLSFTSISSYSIFDTTTVNTNSKGFAGGVFDGRYIYFIPQSNPAVFGQITRYDTTMLFTLASSYSVFDTTTINTNSKGFNGGIFDGRYLYLIPFVNGQITRYDTTLSFTSASSYSTFDMTTVNANSRIFIGGVFDGRYCYFIPYNNGHITRYDITSSFTSASSYGAFDTSVLSVNSRGFDGGVFDGKYVYCIPNIYGLVTRYDTTSPFTSVTSYSIFDTQTINANSKGFYGGIFDGRYLYMVPFNNGSVFGQITVYDAAKPFTYASSYYVIDTTSINANSKGFFGGCFDGKYIYLVPNFNGQITRIEGYTGAPISNVTPLECLQNVTSLSVSNNDIIQYDSSTSKWKNNPIPKYFSNKTNNLLTEAYNQCFGSGNVGSQKIISTNYIYFFDTTTVNTNSKGFYGAIFDGQYIYLVPNNNGTIFGQVTRYNTLLPFTSSSSYSVFDTTTVNTNSRGFYGGVFDGKYIYFIPYNNGSWSGQITRYDINLSFVSSDSYSVFDMTAVNVNAKGFTGGVFDGKYIYYVPNYNGTTYSGLFVRYDVNLSFTSASSYTTFDTSTVDINSKGFVGGIFDGRYIYLIPNGNGSIFGQITRYDTTLSFTSIASYSVFDTTNVNANSKGFMGSVFDGKYIYFIPNNNGSYFGQITRYEISLPFTSIYSYSVYDITNVNSNSKGFIGGVYDGKYIYFIPNNNNTSGLITVYDTTKSFFRTSSYYIIDTSSINSNSKGFFGGIYDGKYTYLIPYNNGTPFGQITRIEGYTGAPMSNTTPLDCLQNINISSANYNDIIQYDSSTSKWINNPFPKYFFNKTNNLLSEQFNQNGNVGTQKKISTNFINFFDTTSVNTNSKGFSGSIFDGKYIYFIPSNNGSPFGQITRYDSTLPFTSSSSYSIFDMTVVDLNSKGFSGGVFDGKFIYFIPFNNGIPSGQITRYNISLSFLSSSSYNVFDTTTVNINSKGFSGGIFDGIYIYFVPSNNGSSFGQITRYDTTLSFISTSSYAVFDMATVNINNKGFAGGVFDGKCIYFVPSNNGTSGQIVRYDTTLSFVSISSYTIFDISTIDSNNKGFVSGVFDGKYIYYIPSNNGTSGQIVRYDTTLSFTSTDSYVIFNTVSVDSNSKGFTGGVYDGRYLYLIPYYHDGIYSGQITVYDTSLSFTNISSYYVFDMATVNINSKGFIGGIFDGKYIYFVPNFNKTSGQISRLEGYTGMSISNITPLDCLQNVNMTSINNNDIVQYDSSTLKWINNPIPKYLFNKTNNLLSEGCSQSVGTQKKISTNFINFFDTITVNSNSKGFSGGVFDGKYIYLIPYNNGFFFGQITRYDTTLPFNSISSYGVFDSTNIDVNNKGFSGGVFDGKYIYFVPNSNGQILRYDTTLSFFSSTSYSIFDSTVLNSTSSGFDGGIFDGRYVYFIPFNNGFYHGQITRYDTTLSFTSFDSYSVFNTSTVNASSKGFKGGVFDGRYIYLVPYNNGSGSDFGQITRYDTTLPFTSVTSYNVFETISVDINSKGFRGAIFDGRYIYLIPFDNGNSGHITRYDTNMSFTSSSSYMVFDTTIIDTNSMGFGEGVFDGRYLYLIPNNNGTNFGQITVYDTTKPFMSVSSYYVFNTTTINANSKGFLGGVFDGKYIYMVPNINGLITRIEGYTGTPVSNVTPLDCLQNVSIRDPSTFHVLTFDNNSSQWNNSKINNIYFLDNNTIINDVDINLSASLLGCLNILNTPSSFVIFIADYTNILSNAEFRFFNYSSHTYTFSPSNRSILCSLSNNLTLPIYGMAFVKRIDINTFLITGDLQQ